MAIPLVELASSCAWAKATALYRVIYDSIKIQPADADKAPALLSMGHIENLDDHSKYDGISVITSVTIDPGTSRVRLMSKVINTAKDSTRVDFLDRVNWGGLPIFMGGYGIPRHIKNYHLQTHWVCGMLDDFSLGPRQ